MVPLKAPTANEMLKGQNIHKMFSTCTMKHPACVGIFFVGILISPKILSHEGF